MTVMNVSYAGYQPEGETKRPFKLNAIAEFMGLTALQQSFERFNSGSRSAMAVSQSAQYLVLQFPDTPRILTGFEHEIWKATNGIRVPGNGRIVTILGKYQQSSRLVNPEKIVVFMNNDTNELDCVIVPSYGTMHDTFCYPYKDNMRGLTANANIYKGDFLATTPSQLSNGIYATGMQFNTAYINNEADIEDGIMIRRSALQRGKPTAYGVGQDQWGSKSVPLNIYGDAANYKPHGAPGEKVREDGLLLATRNKDEIFDVVGMMPHVLCKPNKFDNLTYVTQEAVNARIVDVDVWTTVNDNSRLAQTPVGMESYSMSLYNQKVHQAKALMDIEENHMRETYGKGKISNRMHKLLTRACGIAPRHNASKYKQQIPSIRRIMRGTPIDEWMVKITYLWDFNLEYGSKWTNLGASKGVTCRICEDHEMPIDKWGRIVDIVVSTSSPVNRLNYGQLPEQYLNAASDFVRMDVQAMAKEGKIEEAFEYLMQFHRISSPDTYNAVKDMNHAEYVQNVCDNPIVHIIPDHNDYVNMQWLRNIEAFRAPGRSQLTLVNSAGIKVTTKAEVLVGSMAWYPLDKSSFHPMSVGVARRQTHGLPSPLSNRDKHSYPTSRQPPRVMAEAETRLIINQVVPEALVDVDEQATNPEATRCSIQQQWHQSSGGMRNLIDRDTIPRGQGRNVGLARAMFEIQGIGFHDINL